MKPSHYPESPRELWNIFWDFTQIPRPSKHEAQILRYIIELATAKNLLWKQDQMGNLVVYVPGSQKREYEPSVLIQNHVDMVTDAVPGKDIDFVKDAIEVSVDGGYVFANETTLGADNGIGCAAALALLNSCENHPPLELLFTVEEETGLDGACELDPSMLKSRVMLNLDTEDWGVLCNGCAGGQHIHLTGQFSSQWADHQAALEFSEIEIALSGLEGGHSGLDIHRGRGNAIKILASMIASFDGDFQIKSFHGGRAHNIIPRDAKAYILIESKEKEMLISALTRAQNDFEKLLGQEWAQVSFLVEEIDDLDKACPEEAGVLSVAQSQKMIDLILTLPNGPQSFEWPQQSSEFNQEVVVKTSCNLAQVHLERGELFIQTSLRSMSEEGFFPLAQQIEAIGRQFELELELFEGYPPWPVKFDSQLLKAARESYRSLFSSLPEVKVYHVGLECGIIAKKMSGIDAISFGPTIKNAHSPTERVEIASVQKFWKLLIQLLATPNLGGS